MLEDPPRYKRSLIDIVVHRDFAFLGTMLVGALAAVVVYQDEMGNATRRSIILSRSRGKSGFEKRTAV
jgi:hypothetical protein